MNATRLAGYLLLLIAAGSLIITLMHFIPDYAAAGAIGEWAEREMRAARPGDATGVGVQQPTHEPMLQTTVTNLRFHVGARIVVNLLVIGALAIAGWWLTTSEVQQVIWIILVGLFLVFSVIVRASPVLPLSVLKFSPGGAFYGAQVQVPIYNDITGQKVIITQKKTMRIAQTLTPDGQPGDLVVLEFPRDSVARQYAGSTLPLTVTGNVRWTAGVAKGTEVQSVPLIVVQSAKSGLPEK